MQSYPIIRKKNDRISDMLCALREVSGLSREGILTAISNDNDPIMEADGIDEEYAPMATSTIFAYEKGKWKVPAALFAEYEKICYETVLSKLEQAGWTESEIEAYKTGKWSDAIKKKLIKTCQISEEELDVLKGCVIDCCGDGLISRIIRAK